MPQTTDPLLGWRNRVHQGDALELMGQLPDECVGLVVTSPPYNLLNSTGGGMRGQGSGDWTSARIEQLSRGYPEHSDDMPRDEYIIWQRLCIDQMLRLLTQDGAIFYVHRPRMQNGLEESPRDILDGYHVRQAIIWDKGGGPNHSPYAFTPGHEVIYLIVKDPSPDGYRCREGVDYSTVWRVPRDKDTSHPAPFPVEIARRCISASNAGVILDPFVGSGSTAVAAVIEGRDYIGIDLHAGYCQSARKRVQRARPGVELADDDTPPVDDTPPLTPPPDDADGQLTPPLTPPVDAIPPLTPPPDDADGQPTPPLTPPVGDTPPLKERELLVYSHIRSLVAGNGGYPVETNARRIATEIKRGERSVQRASTELQRYGYIVVIDRGRNALYGLPGATADDFGMTLAIQPKRSGVAEWRSGGVYPGPGPGINQSEVTIGINRDPGPGHLTTPPLTPPPQDDLPNPASVWRAVLGRLQLEMPREHFDAFLQPCVGHAWRDSNLIVAAASSFVVSWLVLPLHQSMADEALAVTVGVPAAVVYEAMPSVVSAGRTAPIATNVPELAVEDAGEPAVCQHHAEPRWRKRSRWPAAKSIEKREGDEIHYCAGDSGTCSWVGSRKFGVLVDVGEEELNPYDLPRIYNAAQYRRSNPDRGRWL